MIASIQFRDFRVLEDAVLPLGPFNLLIGPNGSGKTTAIRSLLTLGDVARAKVTGAAPAPRRDLAGAAVSFEFGGTLAGARATLRFAAEGTPTLDVDEPQHASDKVISWAAGIRGYVLEPAALARPVPRGTTPVLGSDGSGLPAVLAAMRSQDGERWTEFVSEFQRLLPEFSDVVAGQTVEGQLAFSVTNVEGHSLAPENLSQGALVLLALLAIALAPERPSLLSLEELERGMHPRLLRDVRDTLNRLSFPTDWGDQAPAVQLVVTTHSPYVLDLFVDTPEDVIVATKAAGAATFKRLSDVPEVQDILRSGRLGDLWYSGILGGVP